MGQTLERLMISGSVEECRARGRSPTRWADHIQEITRNMFQDTASRAQDREGWRKLVKKIGADHDSQQ